LVHGCFELVQAFCRTEFVVQPDDFKFHTGCIALVVFLGEVLQGFELVGAHWSHQTGQGIDPRDLDGFTFLSPS
jgi:hypothetical protein